MRIPSVIVPVLLIILSVVGAASAAAAEYSAPSRIVYVCGKDLCTVDPATKAKSRLTKDGAGYGYPSVSLDGHRLAVLRGANVVAGEVGADPSQDFGAIRGLKDVAITPDGAAVATSYWYSEDKLVYRYRYTCGGACLVLETVYTSGASYSPSPGTEGSALQGTSGVGFLGGALLSTGGQAGSYDSATETSPGGTETVCVIATPAVSAAPCLDRVIEPESPIIGAPQPNFSDPAGSPDGRYIAAVLGTDSVPGDGRIIDNPAGENPTVYLYSADSGAKVRAVAAGATSPAFSPDSRSLAYGGSDGWIYLVPVSGGAPRKLVRGTQPTWGGNKDYVSAAGASIPATSARYRGRSIVVKVGCGGVSACRGKLTVKKGNTRLGTRSYRIKASRKETVKVGLSPRGSSAIGKAGRQRIEVTLKPKKGKRASFKLNLRR